MKTPNRLGYWNLMLLWSIRDLARKPIDSFMLFVILTAISFLLAIMLLLSQALAETAIRFLSAAPALVIRHSGPLGWQPMTAENIAKLAAITGAQQVSGRVWGLARHNQQAITIWGIDRQTAKDTALQDLPLLLAPGQALLGSGISASGKSILLQGQTHLTLQIAGRIPSHYSMISHDKVLMPIAEARQLLGLKEGSYSDVAMDVYHDSEQQAIQTAIHESLGFPLTITSREQMTGIYLDALSQRATFYYTLLIPAILAMSLLVTHTVKERISRRHEIGLLRILGWTSADLAAMFLLRAAIIAIPAATVSLTSAFFLVHTPYIQWPASWFLGWSTAPPFLFLSSHRALLTISQITGLIFIPWLTASLIPAMQGIQDDPALLVSGQNA